MQVLKRMILTAAGIAVSVVGGIFPARAQNNVTPTVRQTPPGNFIIVNNGPLISDDPHVSGDLVCYSNLDLSSGLVTVHYFNLATQTDSVIPQQQTQDLLCDVRGSTITFTRVFADGSQAIMQFDASGGAQPVEVAPLAKPFRDESNIGDQTIAWQDLDFGPLLSDAKIVAYNRANGSTQVLTPSAVPQVQEQTPAMSPDGRVIVYLRCPAPGSYQCSTWGARLANGSWTAQQLVSEVQGNQSHPDTDGAIIAYSATYLTNGVPGDHLVWQPVAGGTEQVLNVPGSLVNPSMSSGFIAFSVKGPTDAAYQIAIYNTANNVLYNVQADLIAAGVFPQIPGGDSILSDISVTTDGKVRVVWRTFDTSTNQPKVYAYTFNLPAGDFNFGAISPLAIAAGGSASTNVGVNPLNGFASPVNLAVTGQPIGVTATLSPNQVMPSGGNPASSVLNVSVADSVTPGNFTLTVIGTSGTLSHSTTANVTVTSTTGSITNLIGDLLNAGCIDNGGIANALSSKLAAAQSAISAGNIQTAINTLTALKNQINAQAGKHIATSCTVAGVALNPVSALLLDVQGLIDSLRVSLTPDPITGYVTDASGMGLPGASVSIFDAGSNVVANAMTDITGFYFMATTGVLAPGATYTLQVTGFPAGFTASTPANQQFRWQGSAVALSNFVLN